ncbi:spermidine synthase [Brevundimonas sp. GN22]
MTDSSLESGKRKSQSIQFLTPALFAVAIFTSASLVFVVQPMVTKMALPLLGGSPAVWNTAMVFFQTALLAGYLYAHLLQRIPTLRMQALVHIGLLLVAALFLPLQVRGLWGDPDPSAPVLWLLGTLVISIGAPFAILSATAPLLQAWFAKVQAGKPGGQNPYVLYAASNLGSFLALLSYPVLIEPLAPLSSQRITWGIGYGIFVVLILLLLARMWGARNSAGESATVAPRSESIPWSRKLVLIALAAAPSSLMLGVTTHITTDVASAPFLWVIPLALFLLTFVIAFQNRPLIPLPVTLLVQAAMIIAIVITLKLSGTDWLFQFCLHLGAFFFTTLMCHQQMAARRPAPDRLTEFYLLMSIGGVAGGAFTALLAPVIFKTVLEYPIVLLLALLARSNDPSPYTRRDTAMFFTSLVVAVLLPISFHLLRFLPDLVTTLGQTGLRRAMVIALLISGICAFLVRNRVLPFLALMTVGLMASFLVSGGKESLVTDRSFFGILRVATSFERDLGGNVHTMMHGTTLHGAQIQHPDGTCIPTLYYARTTPLGQSITIRQSAKPALNVGLVGQGTGTMLSYMRPTDTFTYFEIDPMVDRISRDPRYFSYFKNCATNDVRTVYGDARLTLKKEPAHSFDYLLIDAFSSDAIPTHLLTKEAISGYADMLTQDGVLVLHLSNRHLDITRPAMAAAEAAGLSYLHQGYSRPREGHDMIDATTEALIIARTPEALDAFKKDGRWSEWTPGGVKPWTDDYVDLFSAMVRDMRKG